jgi:hypothetical protein
MSWAKLFLEEPPHGRKTLQVRECSAETSLKLAFCPQITHTSIILSVASNGAKRMK